MAENRLVALVGSESLLGREIRDIAAGADFELRLIAAEEDDEGALTRVAGEPALVAELTAESLRGVRAILLAGSAESSRIALELAGDAPVIDLTHTAEDRPDARLRAPVVESAEEPEEGAGDLHVVAHPAAIALAMLLRRLHSAEPLRRAVVQIFAPASERDRAGIDELQQQTVALLSFKSLPKAVFDAQAAFNLLARYGEEAPASLEDLESLIERHLASLLALPGDGEGAPMPSLRLVQAPVFHGYSFSVWAEFESNPGADALQASLLTGLIEVRGPGFEPPSNVGHAGQSGIAVGAIEPDRNEPEACWLWMVTDNLRLLAENGVAAAREFL